MTIPKPKRYGREVFFGQEDEGFIARCPEFPYVSAFGETREEAK